MGYARGYHSCVLVPLPDKNDLIVVVAGGETSKVETYSFVEQTWKDGQDFCEKGKCYQILGAQAVITPLNMMLFAGMDNEGVYSDLVFELTCGTIRESCRK